MPKFVLREEHFAWFSNLSRDENSIHHNLERARASGFSAPVFFGLGAVWLALEQWSGGKAFALTDLRAQFKRPLYAGRAYDVQIHEERDMVRVHWCLENRSQLLLAFTHQPGLSWPEEQGRFLLWASRTAGRDDGSVLLSLRARFGLAGRNRLVTQRSDRLVISRGCAAGVSEFEWQSLLPRIFVAPTPVLRRERNWHGGARVVVTGASRGLGEALAVELRARGVEVFATSSAVCDLTDEGATRAWAERLPANLNGLMLNACPMIERFEFRECGPRTWLHFVTQGLQLALHATHALLPKLRPDGWICLISSVALEDLPAKMSHYVALKAALEAWLRVVAKENPGLRVFTPRLPPFASRQNALAREALPGADVVAYGLIEKLNLELSNRKLGSPLQIPSCP